MKVFTVGLDQKSPPSPVDKADSPPPGYPSTIATPLPMGPEVAPIIVRKSRGYKGILLVMLGVFLMAIFALTLSEMAYNRSRDENFFRLQWAQLKHRFGYERDQDFGGLHRIVPINRLPEMGEMLAQQQHRGEDAAAAASTTTAAAIAQSESATPRRIFIDNGALKMPTHGGGGASDDSSASTSSAEAPESFVRDARLAFLRSILNKIKQNAEEMGFDGTMQVSVIEVEPQNADMMGAGGRGGSHDKQQQSKEAFGASADPQSSAFLDSFGEFHAPSPFGGSERANMAENSIVEPIAVGGGRGGDAWQQRPAGDFGGFEIPLTQFPQMAQFGRPDIFAFRGPMSAGGGEWRQEMAAPSMPMDERPSFMAGSPLDAFAMHQNGAPRSSEFGGGAIEQSPNQEIIGEVYGRKLGRMLQDLVAARLQSSIMQHAAAAAAAQQAQAAQQQQAAAAPMMVGDE